MTAASGPRSPFVANLLLFPRMLRRAGLPVSLEQSMDFVRALRWIDLEIGRAHV